MPEDGPPDHRHMPQLRGSVAPLHHGDHTGFADALPRQAEDQCVELRLGQRLVHERGSNEAALMKAPSAQPDADAVVHEYLESVTAAIGEDVGVVRVGSAEHRYDPTQCCVGSAAHVHRLHRQPQCIDPDHRSTARTQVAQSAAALTGQLTETLTPPR